MENKLLRIGAAFGLGSVAFLLSACSKNGIVILPVNGAEQKHFEDKWAAIEPILKKHPDDLYYIQDYSKGKPIGEPLGSLPPILLEQSKTDFESLVNPLFERPCLSDWGGSVQSHDFRFIYWHVGSRISPTSETETFWNLSSWSKKWTRCSILSLESERTIDSQESFLTLIVSTGRTVVCVGWFTLHFLLIIIVSLHDISSVLPGDASVLPQGSNKVWRRIETITAALLGERLPASKPLRQGLAAYANGAGIELGYSYFAPSIPGNAKLVFELHYPDGRVEYDLPHVGGAAAGYRVATLLDNLLEIHYARLREAIVQSLVSSVWQEHPTPS